MTKDEAIELYRKLRAEVKDGKGNYYPWGAWSQTDLDQWEFFTDEHGNKYHFIWSLKSVKTTETSEF